MKTDYGDYSDCTCPKCGCHKVTRIDDLEKMHCGGNKWCLNCGRIFNETSIKEKIIDQFEKDDKK